MTKYNTKIFFLFLFTHLLIWTLVPALSNKNLPLDTIEALAWGSNMDWGFNKHPPLSALSVEIFHQVFGSQDWAYYLLAQIYITLTFFVVWSFSKDFLKNETHRMISVLLLAGIYFYNYTTPEFNVYVCATPFWSLTIFYCWQGFKHNRSIDWLLFGVFAALGALSHYLFLYLLLAISVFLLYAIIKNKTDLKCLSSLFIFFLILTPHLIWLSENNYITLTYGLHRTGLAEPNFLNHIKNPLIFLAKQIGIVLPLLLMFTTIISKFKTKINFKDDKLLFLVTVNLLPLISIFITSVSMGIKIRTMWMTPFYMYMGVMLVYIFQKYINLKKIKKFLLFFIIIFILSPSVYLYVSLSQVNKRTDYPGKEIANLVQSRWDKNFNNDIGFVIGDEWFGGNLSYHLESRPKWFNKFDPKLIKSNKGVVYTGNAEVLKSVCPGVFGKIKFQGICMIGSR